MKSKFCFLFIIFLVFVVLGFKAISTEPVIDELIISTSAIKLNCNSPNSDYFFPEEPHFIPLVYGLPLRLIGCEGLEESIMVREGGEHGNDLLMESKDSIRHIVVLFRFENLISFLLFLILFYFISKKYFNSEIALFSVAVFSVLPVIFELGFMVYYEFCFLFFFFLTANYYFSNKDKEKNLKFYIIMFILFVFMLSTRSVFPLLFFPAFLFFEWKRKLLTKAYMVSALSGLFFLVFVWRLDILFIALIYSYGGEASGLIRFAFPVFIYKLFFQLWFFIPALIFYRNKLFNPALSFFYLLLIVYFAFFGITRGGTENRYILVFLALFVFLFSKHLFYYFKEKAHKLNEWFKA